MLKKCELQMLKKGVANAYAIEVISTQLDHVNCVRKVGYFKLSAIASYNYFFELPDQLTHV